MYVCIYIYIYIYIDLFICICIHTLTYMCDQERDASHTQEAKTCICVFIYVHIHICLYTHAYTYLSYSICRIKILQIAARFQLHRRFRRIPTAGREARKLQLIARVCRAIIEFYTRVIRLMAKIPHDLIYTVLPYFLEFRLMRSCMISIIGKMCGAITERGHIESL